MEYFKNKSEKFFREIRSIEIYDYSAVTFRNNKEGIFPISEALYKFDIIPEDFTRNLQRKKRSGNYFYSIDVGFPLLDLSDDNLEKYNANFNKKKFAIVMLSNVEKTLLGNGIEPLRIEVLDNIKNNNSGSDEFFLSITGETIIAPKIVNI